MNRNLENRRYRSRHPDKIKAQRIRYLDKKVRENPDKLLAFEKRFVDMLRRLTRLTMRDKLPVFCQGCGKADDLEIHHLVYRYPLRVQDLRVFCRACHALEHKRIHPQVLSVSLISCGTFENEN